MKKLIQLAKKPFAKKNGEAGQGATEYILLLVVVVAIASFFGPQLRSMVEGKVGSLSQTIQGFTGQ